MTGTRALVRLAARTALRNKLRSFLVFALIALLVGAGTTLATIARSSVATEADRRASVFGQADLLVDFGTDRGRGIPAVLPHSDLDLLVSQLESLPTSLKVSDEAAPQWLTDFDADKFASDLSERFSTTVAQSRSYSPRARGAATGTQRTAPFSLGSKTPNFLVDLNLDDPLSEGMYTLVAGRRPAAPNEIVVASNVAPMAELVIGDELDFSGNRFLVVGLAVQPAEDFFNSAVVTPHGFDLAVGPDPWVTHHFRVAQIAEQTSFDAGEFQSPGAPAAAFAVLGSNGDRARYGGIVVESSTAVRLPVAIATAIFGIQIALVASSAFAVGVRRRVVEFGQLMTTGASAGHIRRLVVLEGAVLGVLGAVVGTAAGAGIAAWLLGRGTFADLGTMYAQRARFEPVDWLGPAIIGVVAAAVAAWWPARTIASVPVTTALAGRMPRKSPRRRTPLWGLVATALGTVGTLVFTWQSLYGDYYGTSFTMIVGLIAGSIGLMFGGFLSLIGTSLAFLGRRADRLPLKARLVVRNSDRHQSRAWASVAAFVAVLALPVAAMAAAESYPPELSRPDNHVAVVGAPVVTTSGEGDFSVDAATVARNQRFFDAFEEEIEAQIGPGEVIRLQGVDRSAFRLKGRRVGGPATATAALVPAIDVIALATPELVSALGVPTEAVAQLDAGTVVMLDQRGDRVVDVALESERSNALPFQSFDAIAPDLGRSIFDTPGMLVNEAGAAQFGDDVREVGLLYISDSPLSPELASKIRSRANDAWAIATAGESVSDLASVPILEIGSDRVGPSNSEVRTLALVVSAALATLIALIGAALAAIEVDRDIESMIATGASPSIRRWLLGAQTTYHLGLAAVLAIPVALLVFWVASRADANSPEQLILPWVTIGVVAIAIPLGVGLLIALLFRSGEPVVSRRLS